MVAAASAVVPDKLSVVLTGSLGVFCGDWGRQDSMHTSAFSVDYLHPEWGTAYSALCREIHTAVAAMQRTAIDGKLLQHATCKVNSFKFHEATW